MQLAKSFASSLVGFLLGGGFAVRWPALGQQLGPVAPRVVKPQTRELQAAVTHLRHLTHLFTTLAVMPLALSLFAPGAIAQDNSALSLDLQEAAISEQLAVKAGNTSAVSWDEALPEEAQKLVSQLLEDPYEEISQIRARQFIGLLQIMQDTYTRSNRLEEASAIRNAIADLKTRASGVLPDPGNLIAYRGQFDRRIRFTVTGRKTGSVWGSDVYTDDSDLGTVAVHAGLLRDGQKGVVEVTIYPGNAHYQGSAQNGITSSDYESWDGSYSVAKGKPATPLFVDKTPPEVSSKTGEEALPEEAGRVLDSVDPIPADGHADMILTAIKTLESLQAKYAGDGKLEEALAIHSRNWKLIVALAGAQTVQGNLVAFRGRAGQSLLLETTGHKSGSVWGTGAYTDDSDLGTAAVHAGLLRPGHRGIVRVTLLPGNVHYEGSFRHGITSGSYETWEASYRIEAVNLSQVLGSRRRFPERG